MSRDLLPGIDRARIIRWIALWFVIAGIFGLCAGAALVFLGGAGGLLGAGTAAVIGQSGAGSTEAQQAAQAGAELAVASGLLTVYGILLIILAPIRLVVAAGLYGRKRWARMGVVIVAGIGALDSLLGLFTGGGFANTIIPLVIDGFLLYLFYTDTGIQQVLSN